MADCTLDHFTLVSDVVHLHGTMSPTEIQKILKTDIGKTVSRTTIYKHLQAMRESNLSWISAQAKAAYMQTVRKILYNKKKRLMELEAERIDCTTPRTKAYYAQVINETESELKQWMEGLPLLKQFTSVMNNDKQEDSVIISD